VILLFFFGQLFQLVRRIPQNAVKDAASIIFPIGITLIRQADHVLNELQGFGNVQVARFHAFLLSGCYIDTQGMMAGHISRH
jgi:hypothetical protein